MTGNRILSVTTGMILQRIMESWMDSWGYIWHEQKNTGLWNSFPNSLRVLCSAQVQDLNCNGVSGFEARCHWGAVLPVFFLRIHNFWTRETLAICRETLAICRERWRFVEWLKNISKIQNVFSIFVGFQIFFRISVPKHRENPLPVCTKTPRISENIHFTCWLHKKRECPIAVCRNTENIHLRFAPNPRILTCLLYQFLLMLIYNMIQVPFAIFNNSWLQLSRESLWLLPIPDG